MTSPERRDALQTYLLEIALGLRLDAWDIEVIDDEPAEDSIHGTMLDITPQPLRWYASVRVGEYFDTRYTSQEQRQVAVHEVLHLTQARTFEWLGQGILKEWMPMATGMLIENLLREDLEIQTDFIARLLAPSLPLPPEWPDA